jgi:hypothetical protein
MGQLSTLEGLTMDSEILPRRHLGASLREEATAIVIACHGKEIRVPRFGADAVRFALSTPRFRVRDLPGQLDNNSRLALIRRLVREGLLIVTPQVAGPQNEA